MVAAGGIGSLPAEIVLNILQYLDQSDLSRAAVVCGDCRYIHLKRRLAKEL